MKNIIRTGSVFLAMGIASSIWVRANSITVTEVSATDVLGGSVWTYDLSFVNSTLRNGDFITINDFGPATLVTSPGPGWVFSQAAVGPNSLPAVDRAGVVNATLTWEGGNGVVVSPDPATVVDKVFKLSSPGAASSPFSTSDYTTIDEVTSGIAGIVGTDSRVIGSVVSPSVQPASVPDGGSSATLLGISCAGILFLRRKWAIQE